jgi:hypothetical protein
MDCRPASTGAISNDAAVSVSRQPVDAREPDFGVEADAYLAAQWFDVRLAAAWGLRKQALTCSCTPTRPLAISPKDIAGGAASERVVIMWFVWLPTRARARARS